MTDELSEQDAELCAHLRDTWAADPSDHTKEVRPCPKCEQAAARIEALAAQVARDDEHYAAAMTMGEKHRRNWVEACQAQKRAEAEAAALRKDAERYRAFRELSPSKIIRLGEQCFRDSRPYREFIDAMADAAIDSARKADGSEG